MKGFATNFKFKTNTFLQIVDIENSWRSKAFVKKKQVPPLLFDEGSESTKVYPEIPKLLSLEGVLESRCVSDMQTTSNYELQNKPYGETL